MSIVGERNKAEMQQAFEQMWRELYQWREKHPEATIDEIAGQVTPRRRALMGQLLVRLACQAGDGRVIEGLVCPDCGAEMAYKGRSSRDVSHLEGEAEIARAYYYCAACASGLFPPG